MLNNDTNQYFLSTYFLIINIAYLNTSFAKFSFSLSVTFGVGKPGCCKSVCNHCVKLYEYFLFKTRNMSLRTSTDALGE